MRVEEEFWKENGERGGRDRRIQGEEEGRVWSCKVVRGRERAEGESVMGVCGSSWRRLVGGERRSRQVRE
jgi:hypothetical protein